MQRHPTQARIKTINKLIKLAQNQRWDYEKLIRVRPKILDTSLHAYEWYTRTTQATGILSKDKYTKNSLSESWNHVSAWIRYKLNHSVSTQSEHVRILIVLQEKKRAVLKNMSTAPTALYHAHLKLCLWCGHLHPGASNIRRIKQPMQETLHMNKEPMSKHDLSQAEGIRVLLTFFAFTSALAPIKSSATCKWPLREAQMSEVQF